MSSALRRSHDGCTLTMQKHSTTNRMQSVPGLRGMSAVNAVP